MLTPFFSFSPTPHRHPTALLRPFPLIFFPGIAATKELGQTKNVSVLNQKFKMAGTIDKIRWLVLVL